MSETYTLGQPVELESTITVPDEDGVAVLTTPESATFIVRPPDGIETEYEHPSEEVEEVEEGVLRMQIDADQLGPWYWRFESVAPSAPQEGHFHVESHFPSRGA